MYASIERYEHATTTADELIPAGRTLAGELGRLPGFVAYVLLSGEDGDLIGVSLFEDEVGLRSAAQLPQLGQRLGTERAERRVGEPAITSGEVLVQKGL